jgi:hypothetical protein
VIKARVWAIEQTAKRLEELKRQGRPAGGLQVPAESAVVEAAAIEQTRAHARN